MDSMDFENRPPAFGGFRADQGGTARIRTDPADLRRIFGGSTDPPRTGHIVDGRGDVMSVNVRRCPSISVNVRQFLCPYWFNLK